MRRLSRLLPIVAIAVAACPRASADSRGAKRPYKVGTADRGEVRVAVEETGIVEPERQIVVKSPISGIVDALSAREGDGVRPGQALARIVPDIAQANSFAQISSAIAQAEIARANADREYTRARELAQGGGITQSELDGRRTAFEQSDNQLRTARGQLRLVQRSGVRGGQGVQWAAITAPAGGVIIKRGVEQGETVVGGTSAFGGGTELFTIADLTTLRVKAAINEVDIGKVKVGDSVALTVDAFPGDTVRGVVRLVPPAARQQERVRVFDVEIRASGGGGVLRPGMTANVRITGPARAGVVRVPVEAVLIEEGKPVVYRLVAGQPVRTPVTLGLGDLSYVEI
ncbi:MAG: efflux RND transporter periplasmic adaptor subunit, partial [Gemmatimonadales bacterium]|nr:efflux RND transporter periplasmic adaptor subunit [Gemmatimonadales bacterium]